MSTARRVDPAPTRSHIQTLRDAGLAVGDIADRSGISETVINRIRRGQHRHINRTTANAICAVPVPKHPDPRHRGYVDATAARNLLRDLTARGWTLTYLANQTATLPGTLGHIRAGRTPRLDIRLHHAITHTHQQLAHANPADHGITTRSIGQALLTAGRNGWTATT